MNLSKNFTLEELLRSATASNRYPEQYNPPAKVIDNLKALCVHVLQPLRDFIGQPIRVSSGYRCPALNRAIRGANNSQHIYGQAADISATGEMTNNELFKAIKESGVVWDQCIVEFRGKDGEPDWIHISYAEKNRMQILEAVKGKNGVTRYLVV